MSDLFVDNIKHQSSQGSGTITIGSSGEKVDLGTGVSGGTLTNTPAWLALTTGVQTVAEATATQVNFGSADIDTHNGMDLTNNKYVVPETGKYVIYFGANLDAVNGNNTNFFDWYFYLNGSAAVRSYYRTNTLDMSDITIYDSTIISLNANDELELYCRMSNSSNTNKEISVGRFGGHKIIGA